MLERTRGGLNGARIAVAVDIGWHDALAAQPPDVLSEHAAGFGGELNRVGHVGLSIRLEATQTSRQHEARRARAGGQDVQVANHQWLGGANGAADDLSQAGGEDAQHGVPGQL